jgi:spoIIIJ-associated protein
MSETEAEAGEAGRAGTDTEAEATGETVGEAKWTALRELERRFPGLDKGSVEFVVLSEGERGLLGVGFVPARVIARVTKVPAAVPPPPSQVAGQEPASPVAALVSDVLSRVCEALGLAASVSIREEAETVVATIHGRDLGLLIGKHGRTIDALQYLTSAIVFRAAGERTDVVVDAAGYRERRRTALEALADRTAARVVSTGRAAALDPMSAPERKIVHLRLQDRDDVETESDGVEPNRHVVIRRAGE